MSDLDVELLLPEPAASDAPARRRIAVAAAAIGVVAALMVYASLDAGGRAARADREGRRLSTEQSAQVRMEAATVEYAERTLTEVAFLEARADAAEHRANAWTVDPASLNYGPPDLTARVAGRAESDAWLQAADAVKKTNPVFTDQRLGLPGDSWDHDFRVDRFRIEQGVESRVSDALSEAQGDQSEAWDRRSNRAVVLLTVAGAALVLLGLAAALSGVARWIMVGPALVLAMCSVLGGLGLIRDDVYVASPRAVRLTVEADALRRTARLHHGKNDLQTARTLLDDARTKAEEATKADPAYAPARDVLGDILFNQGSPQGPGEAVSILDPAFLPRVLEERRQAVELSGGRDGGYLLSLGFEEFLAGRYVASEAATRRALGILEDDPVALGNLGVALAGQGREKQAVAAYDDMIEAVEPSSAKRIYAGARTDLEILAHQKPEAAPLVRRLSEHLVLAQLRASLTGWDVVPPAEVTGLGVELTAKDGDVFRSTVKGDRKDLPLVHVWFYRSDDASPWAEKPSYTWVPTAPDQKGTEVTINRGVCIASGQYRVDLYAGGRWAASAEHHLAETPLGVLLPYSQRELSVRTCRPAGWTLEKATNRIITTFKSPDGSKVFGLGTIDVGGYAQTGLTEDQRSQLVRSMATDILSQTCGGAATRVDRTTMAGLGLPAWHATLSRGNDHCGVVASLKYFDRQGPRAGERIRREDPIHFIVARARDAASLAAMLSVAQRSTVWEARDF